MGETNGPLCDDRSVHVEVIDQKPVTPNIVSEVLPRRSGNTSESGLGFLAALCPVNRNSYSGLGLALNDGPGSFQRILQVRGLGRGKQQRPAQKRTPFRARAEPRRRNADKDQPAFGTASAPVGGRLPANLVEALEILGQGWSKFDAQRPRAGLGPERRGVHVVGRNDQGMATQACDLYGEVPSESRAYDVSIADGNADDLGGWHPHGGGTDFLRIPTAGRLRLG